MAHGNMEFTGGFMPEISQYLRDSKKPITPCKSKALKPASNKALKPHKDK